MENNSIIPNISQNILINSTIFVPEIEKQKVEEELENYKKKIKDSEMRKSILEAELTRTTLSIKSYIDTEKILREENEKLNQKIMQLENENKELKMEINDLTTRITNLEKKENNNQRLLQISQCVYNYKDKIWSLLFQKDKIKKQRQLGKNNLRDILTGSYDNELTEQQLVIKNKIAENIKKNNPNITYFFNALNMITDERNNVSHPKIEPSNINILRDEFLNYCNEIWEDDTELNNIFTQDIFSILSCSSTDFIL
jgi:chromosome segregation ATPase